MNTALVATELAKLAVMSRRAKQALSLDGVKTFLGDPKHRATLVGAGGGALAGGLIGGATTLAQDESERTPFSTILGGMAAGGALGAGGGLAYDALQQRNNIADTGLKDLEGNTAALVAKDQQIADSKPSLASSAALGGGAILAGSAANDAFQHRRPANVQRGAKALLADEVSLNATLGHNPSAAVPKAPMGPQQQAQYGALQDLVAGRKPVKGLLDKRQMRTVRDLGMTKRPSNVGRTAGTLGLLGTGVGLTHALRYLGTESPE